MSANTGGSAAKVVPLERQSGDDDRPFKVGIVGAGFIVEHHLAALETVDHLEVVGICDLAADRANKLARDWNVDATFSDLETMLETATPDAVHVLVPPAHHAAVVRQVLEARVHVFAEKPLAPNSATCRRLARCAEDHGVALGVNHNFNFHPQFLRLCRDVRERHIGRLEHLLVTLHVPLRQLSAGQTDHWMFQHYGNILLEQAPHPLAQVFELLGPPNELRAQVADSILLGPERPFHRTWQIALTCEQGTATVYLSFGHEHLHSSITAIGQDGVIRADLGKGTYSLRRQTRYLEPVDQALGALREASAIAGSGLKAFTDYAGSLVLRRGRSDAFFRCMQGSVSSFYEALRSGEQPATTGDHAAVVIETCERAIAEAPAPIAAVAATGKSPSREPVTTAPAIATGRQPGVDVLLLGGTGFIGRHLARELNASGRSIRLLTRRPMGNAAIPPRPPLTANGSAAPVEQCGGDIRDPEAVENAVRGARYVVHMAASAHQDWSDYQSTYVDGACNVARACIKHGVERLVYASTIAAYYLGDGREVITEDTPLDLYPQRRALYSRAKIAAERELESHAEEGLSIVTLRPGVVVGEGGLTRHTGVGLWPSPIHCLGWGANQSPLPFVLAEDVAAAFAATLEADVSGMSFNLVGDVRPTAAEYVNLLALHSARRIALHRQATGRLWGIELFKWLVKRLAGRDAEWPSYRDLRSRTLAAQFDCSAAKKHLNWAPVDDQSRFVERGILAALNTEA